MSVSENKKIFLIVASQRSKCEEIEKIIKQRIPTATIYSAADAPSALVKISNAVPNIIVTELDNLKTPGTTFVETLLRDRGLKETAIIIAQALPLKESYLDEIALGRIQFLESEEQILEDQLVSCLYRALEFAVNGENINFRSRFLTERDVLLTAGEKGKFVYILLRGEMQAFNTVDGNDVVLGKINEGEFVGEMAFVNGEPRSASVRALSECELIEIPMGTFERVLYLRPAWAKSLVLTLSRRLKAANTQQAGVPRRS